MGAGHLARGHQNRESAEVPITVFLADDNVIVREGVRALLGMESDLEIVGVAGDYDELIAGATEAAPQVLVTDIRMPPNFQQEGIDAAKEISSADRSSILGTLNRDVAGMNSVEIKIAADTTLKSATADYKTIDSTYRIREVAIPQSRLAAALSVVQ